MRYQHNATICIYYTPTVLRLLLIFSCLHIFFDLKGSYFRPMQVKLVYISNGLFSPTRERLMVMSTMMWTLGHIDVVQHRGNIYRLCYVFRIVLYRMLVPHCNLDHAICKFLCICDNIMSYWVMRMHNWYNILL